MCKLTLSTQKTTQLLLTVHGTDDVDRCCQWVDFYVYCKSDFHCERLRFEAEFCSEMMMKLDYFYFDYHILKLLQIGA